VFALPLNHISSQKGKSIIYYLLLTFVYRFFSLEQGLYKLELGQIGHFLPRFELFLIWRFLLGGKLGFGARFALFALFCPKNKEC